MKGHEHLILSILTVICLYLVGFHIIDRMGPSAVLEALGLDMVELFILACAGVFLASVGALLPDSDSNNKHAMIFYGLYAPFGYGYRVLENILAFIFNEPVGHRQTLHRVSGVIAGSIAIMLALSIILLKITSIWAVLFLFCNLALGQLLHLAQDKIADDTHGWAVIIYLCLLGGIMFVAWIFSQVVVT